MAICWSIVPSNDWNHFRSDDPKRASNSVFDHDLFAGSALGGGVPVILPPMSTGIDELIERFDGFIFSGGDDPKTEPFGVETHSKVTPVLDDRQRFETELMTILNEHPEIPVLGICLGMQMMALCHGGVLNQHLPDTHTSHSEHWSAEHAIDSIDEGIIKSGSVWSMHRQAVDDSGTMRVISRSSDGIIEAIDDPACSFYLGVQWHPERTTNIDLGQGVINQLVKAAKRYGQS
mgnify:CR=1 FL=1